jgi:hypothetical protein
MVALDQMSKQLQSCTCVCVYVYMCVRWGGGRCGLLYKAWDLTTCNTEYRTVGRTDVDIYLSSLMNFGSIAAMTFMWEEERVRVHKTACECHLWQ